MVDERAGDALTCAVRINNSSDTRREVGAERSATARSLWVLVPVLRDRISLRYNATQFTLRFNELFRSDVEHVVG